jgi:beta-mannosidase
MVQNNYIEERGGISLNGIWEFCYENEPVSDIKNLVFKYKSNIPQSIYWNLFEEGVLPHPYYGCNSKEYQWVDKKIWYYKKRFFLTNPNGGIPILCFDGVGYYSAIWLNGKLIGNHEGLFGGPYININEYINYESENELVIEIKTSDPVFKKNRLSSFIQSKEIIPWNINNDNDTSNGHFTVLGIWRNVRIEFVPQLHLSRPFVYTDKIGKDKASIKIQCEICDNIIDELSLRNNYEDGNCDLSNNNGINKEINGNYTVELKIFEKDTNKCIYSNEEKYEFIRSGTCSIYNGINGFYYYNSDTSIVNPRLWWPYDMGEQNLYYAEISLKKENILIDKVSCTFGIRTIKLDYSKGIKISNPQEKFQFIINNKKIFLKGMNWAPIDFLYREKQSEYDWLLDIVKSCNVELLRVWCGGFIF